MAGAAGDTSVQIVSAPINATSIQTALDAAIDAVNSVAKTVSGSCFAVPFNDGRALAIACVRETV